MLRVCCLEEADVDPPADAGTLDDTGRNDLLVVAPWDSAKGSTDISFDKTVMADEGQGIYR